MFYNDLYSEVAARFSNWLEVSTTGNDHIADLALDYINRALGSLLLEAPRGWDYLTVDRYELTLGGDTGLECDLPSDCGVVLRVYTDPTATHKPTIYYSNEGKVSNGFRMIRNFTKAAGHSGTKIKFYYAPIATPFLEYQILVPNFEGSGTEYCAFPGELMLLEAQRIRCREKGLIKEWETLKTDYNEMLDKFKQKHQNVAMDMEININDAQGVPVLIPEYGLQSGMKTRQQWGKRNDMDFVNR